MAGKGHENYDKVWQRVIQSAAGQETEHSAAQTLPPDTGEQLRAFMDEESLNLAYCQALYRRTRANGAVRAQAQQCRRALHRLRTAYYIQTGKVYDARTVQPQVTAVSQMLRLRVLTLRACAERYMKASVSETQPQLRELYAQLSREKTQQAGQLSGLLETMMR